LKHETSNLKLASRDTLHGCRARRERPVSASCEWTG
jgi:hypothetical protein